MAIKRKMTAQEIPQVDTSPSYNESEREFNISCPDGIGWTLERSFRGEYNIFHVWKRGDTDYDSDYENCWSSMSDDVVNNIVGGGNKFSISITDTETEKSVDGTFIPFETFIHGGSVFWEGDSSPKSISLEVVANATETVSGTMSDIDVDGKIYPVSDNLGNYDIGANFTLVDNKNHTGHWDFIDYQLQPNLTQTGKYDLYNKEVIVARLINSFDLLPASSGEKTISSGNAWKVFPNYNFRFKVHDNNSNCKVTLMFHMIKRKTVSY